MLRDEIVSLKGLPLSMKFVLIGCLALTAFSATIAILIMFSSGFKLDPGLATLTGSVVGLGIIAYQARLGFANLTRSQANQAQLDREARLHKAEIENSARLASVAYETSLLQASIRAEIAALMHSVHTAGKGSYNMAMLAKALHENGSQNPSKILRLSSFDAPIFKANIDKLGLLGVSIAADVIRVLSKAKPGMNLEQAEPIPYAITCALYASDYDAMNKWHDDLHHVAVRIIAAENGQPDPGTILTTYEERYKKLPSIKDLLPNKT